jgi:hypothetical protein
LPNKENKKYVVAGAHPEFFIGGGALPEALYNLFYLKNYYENYVISITVT